MRTIGVIFSILFFASLVAAAAPSVSITSTLPTAVNPAVSPVNLNFTLQNPVASDVMTVTLVVSADNSFGGDDALVTDVNPNSLCNNPVDYTTPQNCTYAWSGNTSISDGTKYLIVRAINTTTNETTDVATSSSTILDKTAPTFTTTPALSNTNWTTSPVDLTAACDGTGTTCTLQYKLGSDTYVDFTSPKNFTSGAGTLLVRAVDQAGNELVSSALELKIDTTAPTHSGSATTSFTKDKTPTITITASDTLSGLASATLQCSGGTIITKTMTSSPLTVEDFDITTNGCPSGNGSRDVLIKVKDAVGNETANATVTIKYDGTAPSKPQNLDDTDVTDDLIAMDWSASTDSGGSGMDKYFIYRATENDFDEADNIGTVQSNDDLEFSDDGLDACKDYYYWVTAIDEAGNESEESNVLDITTEGCSNNNNNNNNTNNSSGAGGASTSSGGGAGNTCNVTFDIPASVYAGETITAKVSGSTYANGYFRVTPDGKATVKIEQTGLAKNSWSGPYTIPAQIGIKLTFRFGADGCLSSVTRNVKDPATKNIVPVLTTEPAAPSDNIIPVLQSESAPKIPLATENVVLLLDALPTFMGSAGFNAENTSMRDGIISLLSSWKYIKTVSVVPGTDEGKYALRITLSMENTTKNGTIKIVEEIPKSFAESATQLEANYPMTVLKDDPLIQFEITGLTEGQKVDVQITSKEQYSLDEANAKAKDVAGDAITPSLLFASGVAGANPNSQNGRPLLDITGLASGVGSVAPFVVGLVVFAGIILISVRVVKGSVEGADNPILRSASGIERGGSRSLRAPPSVKGRKIWKKDDAY